MRPSGRGVDSASKSCLPVSLLRYSGITNKRVVNIKTNGKAMSVVWYARGGGGGA